MRKAYLLLLLSTFTVSSLYGQESCSIYGLVLDSLYKADLNVLVRDHEQAKTNSQSADDHSSEDFTAKQVPYMIFMETELINFQEHWARPWIRKIIDNKEELRQQEFYPRDKEMRLRCEDFGVNFCYELISLRQSDTFDYSSAVYCPAKDAEFVYKKKVKWSQLVFSGKQNFAILFCEVKHRRGRGDEVIWLFTLVREDDKWAINSCDRSRTYSGLN